MKEGRQAIKRQGGHGRVKEVGWSNGEVGGGAGRQAGKRKEGHGRVREVGWSWGRERDQGGRQGKIGMSRESQGTGLEYGKRKGAGREAG